ncbi:hypothetical protein RUM44_006003 [Polyplax serrata]|uniref:Deoxyhypusine synthase n=1 Tax=Polyplax serrata TaxID=468196 RepID=A0ABR1AYQ2_POLSC
MADSLNDAKNAVLLESENLPSNTPIVKGFDWNKGVDYDELLDKYMTTGFQATNLGLAIEQINLMLKCRDEKLVCEESSGSSEIDELVSPKTNCTIFLGYTSNMISSGLRESIRFLVEHKMVDCIVTTAGGVEEDFIKCLAPTFLGDFNLDGKTLREKGINRIGNLLVPNNNYCLFEDWILPIFDKMVEEQKTKNVIWSPSRIIDRLGQEINDKSSVYYWAAKNNIPVFCPALTDGSIGDMMFFHSYRNPGLVVDILSDLKRINSMALKAKNTGMLILGSGVVKHHICNANLMRNGADYSVFINTSNEFDGSDSGARPDEAISWGKIRKTANPVKVYADATIVFPLLLAQTFSKYHFKSNSKNTI